MDWDRIADEVELRTNSLFNDSFRRRFEEAPSIPAPVEKIWQSEEKEAASRRLHEKLEGIYTK